MEIAILTFCGTSNTRIEIDQCDNALNDVQLTVVYTQTVCHIAYTCTYISANERYVDETLGLICLKSICHKSHISFVHSIVLNSRYFRWNFPHFDSILSMYRLPSLNQFQLMFHSIVVGASTIPEPYTIDASKSCIFILADLYSGREVNNCFRTCLRMILME